MIVLTVTKEMAWRDGRGYAFEQPTLGDLERDTLTARCENCEEHSHQVELPADGLMSICGCGLEGEWEKGAETGKAVPIWDFTVAELEEK